MKRSGEDVSGQYKVGRTFWDLVHEDFVERFPRLYFLLILFFIILLLGIAAYLVLDMSRMIPSGGVVAELAPLNLSMTDLPFIGNLQEELRGDEGYWLETGIIAADEGRFDEALEAFDTVIELNSTSGEAWRHKGFVFYAMGRDSEAMACLNRSLSINPLDSEAWCLKGELFLASEKGFEALEALNHAVLINPGMGFAWYLLGSALYITGSFEDAVKSYDRAIDLGAGGRFPEDVWIERGIAQSEMGLLEEAAESFKTAVTLNSSSGYAWYNLGYAQLVMGHDEEAKNSFLMADSLGDWPAPPTFSYQAGLHSNRSGLLSEQLYENDGMSYAGIAGDEPMPSALEEGSGSGTGYVPNNTQLGPTNNLSRDELVHNFHSNGNMEYEPGYHGQGLYVQGENSTAPSLSVLGEASRDAIPLLSIGR